VELAVPIPRTSTDSGRFIVFYLLKVYALLGGIVFLSAGLILLTLLAWIQVQEYLAAQQRIQNRLASFVKSLANSRNTSRSHVRISSTPHEIQ
jgi:hypothetical protein